MQNNRRKSLFDQLELLCEDDLPQLGPQEQSSAPELSDFLLALQRSPCAPIEWQNTSLTGFSSPTAMLSSIKSSLNSYVLLSNDEEIASETLYHELPSNNDDISEKTTPITTPSIQQQYLAASLRYCLPVLIWPAPTRATSKDNIISGNIAATETSTCRIDAYAYKLLTEPSLYLISEVQCWYEHLFAKQEEYINQKQQQQQRTTTPNPQEEPPQQQQQDNNGDFGTILETMSFVLPPLDFSQQQTPYLALQLLRQFVQTAAHRNELHNENDGGDDDEIDNQMNIHKRKLLDVFATSCVPETERRRPRYGTKEGENEVVLQDDEQEQKKQQQQQQQHPSRKQHFHKHRHPNNAQQYQSPQKQKQKPTAQHRSPNKFNPSHQPNI